MNHLDPNDPRFTAKALGEDEPQPIDPDAKKAFESLKAFTHELKRDLQQQAGADSPHRVAASSRGAGICRAGLPVE